jgi:hypothetical protein
MYSARISDKFGEWYIQYVCSTVHRVWYTRYCPVQQYVVFSLLSTWYIRIYSMLHMYQVPRYLVPYTTVHKYRTIHSGCNERLALALLISISLQPHNSKKCPHDM